MRYKGVLCSAVLLLCAIATVAPAQTKTSKQMTAEALVADLYKAHDHKRSPFFQTKSRALLNKYFAKSLADLIWKDRITSKGEVGVIDGDPLYDAQDMEIKNFAIGKATYEGNKARVNVTFENFGEKKSLILMLVKGTTGWRIDDIDYGQHGTLRGWFKEASK